MAVIIAAKSSFRSPTFSTPTPDFVNYVQIDSPMSLLMTMGLRCLVAGCLCWPATMAAQAFVAPKTYDVDDAYEIYNLLLPHEESYGFAKGTLIIQEATAPNPVSESCVAPDAASRFKDAIADYGLVNSQPWLLQRRYEIQKTYEIVGTDTIDSVLKDGGWEGFYKRYPDSGGYIIMSAVGFNEEKTRAIVYTGSSCGGLCGSWRFHLLEKIKDKWTEVPGIRCAAMS